MFFLILLHIFPFWPSIPQGFEPWSCWPLVSKFRTNKPSRRSIVKICKTEFDYMKNFYRKFLYKRNQINIL